MLKTATTEFDYTIDNNTIVSTADIVNEWLNNYYDMSFVSHRAKEYDYDTFKNIWSMYVKRYSSDWTVIYNNLSRAYDPVNSYSETKTITPDITVGNTTTYGRKITNYDNTSDGTTYGKVITDQTNTYDGTLRDVDKSTNSGSDTRNITNDGWSANSGTDTNTQTTTGSTTETRSGYSGNAPVSLQADIDFRVRNDLYNIIIDGFAKEILFYDNSCHNRGVFRYGF